MSSKSVCDLLVGGFYSALYPCHNFRGLTADLEFRRFKVLAIRDTRLQPVEKEWVRQRPTLCRGRWLVVVEDLDRGEQRQFYWESMTCVQELNRAESEPLTRAEYCVIENNRLTFSSKDPSEVAAFRLGRGAGQICAVMKERAAG
jgi:hypothetical protein